MTTTKTTPETDAKAPTPAYGTIREALYATVDDRDLHTARYRISSRRAPGVEVYVTAENEADALDVMARDVGFMDFADAERTMGADVNDLIVERA